MDNHINVISGVARCGKDTFFNLFKSNFQEEDCLRIAFADELKKELNTFLVKNFRISAYTENNQQKEIIRPIMVSYGLAKREVSKGKYWINKVKKQIKSSDNRFVFITDVRFPNEIWQIKELGGFVLHIEREGNLAPNKEEEDNDPKNKEISDFHFKWKDFEKEEEGYSNKCVEEFIKKYNWDGRENINK